MIDEILLFSLILVLTSFWCIGVFISFDASKIFGKVGTFLAERLPGFLSAPTFNCVTCMASFWGLASYMTILYGHFGAIPLIPFLGCLCGLNYFLSQFIKDGD